MDNYIINELSCIKNRFATIIQELEKRDGLIDSSILNLIDDINKLSVQI